MGRKTISAQVDDESDLWRDFEEFREDYESQSEAVRAAIRAGVQRKEANTEDRLVKRAALILLSGAMFSVLLLALAVVAAALGETAITAALGAGALIIAVLVVSAGAAVLFGWGEKVAAWMSGEEVAEGSGS
jgi:Arc/MetJ-type ribon-helix-helix transcriptional regulator